MSAVVDSQTGLASLAHPAVAARVLRKLFEFSMVVWLALLLVWPAIALLIGVLYDAAPGERARWGLGAFRRVLLQPAFWNDLRSTLLITAVAVPLGIALGLFFALLSGSFDRRWRRVLDPIVLVAFTLPPLFYSLSYAILGSGRGGLLNGLSFFLLGLRPGINFTSWFGLLFVSVLRASAGAYLYVSPVIRELRRSSDEAAQVCGASTWSRISQVLLPQLRPALLGVTIILVLAHLTLFDAVLILGEPARIDSLATFSYELLGTYGLPDYPAASTVALFILVAALGLVAAQRRLVHVDRSAIISGKPEPALAIGLSPKMRAIAAILVLVWLFFLFALPLLSIGVTSLSPFPGVYTHLTFGQYGAVLTDGEPLRSFLLTLGLAGGSSAIGVAVALVLLDLQYTRRGSWIGWFANYASMMPLAMAGVVGAIGYLWAILLVPGGTALFGTPILLVIVLSVGTIPMSLLMLRGSYVQFDPLIVDAAKISGQGAFSAFISMRLPLLMPAIASVLYLAFINASGALDAALILGNAAMKPLPALIFESYASMQFAKASALLVFMLVSYGGIRLALQLLVWLARKDLRPRILGLSFSGSGTLAWTRGG